MTLAQLAGATGISKALCPGWRPSAKPNLELLLPIAQAFQAPLEELVGAPEVGDPRIRLRPRSRRGRIVVPLTSQANGRHAWKV